MYRNKRVLVAGGTGLIGKPLVEKLLQRGAQVRIVSLDDPSLAHPAAEFIQGNLTSWPVCRAAVKGVDLVFNLAGTKGAVSTGRRKAASFFVPHLVFNTLLMEAARCEGVERYLYTSTIGIYPEREDAKPEDCAWSAPPGATNLYAGWAKRMGELQADAYREEFDWSQIAIVRPANIYGPYDYFEGPSAMVVPSLIRRAVCHEDPMVVWGDGSCVRDFLYADDCAEGMLAALERGADCQPINLGCGVGVTIRQLVETICAHIPGLNVVWDTDKPSGEKVRVLDITRAKEKLAWTPSTSLHEGIGKTIEWYRANRAQIKHHHNVFNESALIAG